MGSEITNYVSGINCSPKYAFEEMKLTKETFGKEDGILGYHAYQSFKPGEVSPEQAHEIGVELANEMWGDRFQALVSTHTNTDNSELKIGEYTKQEIEVKTLSSKRELLIPDILFEAILEERKKCEKNKIRRQNDKTYPFKDYNYIICSTYGNLRSKDFHFEYWKNLLKECGLPNIRFHDLRATYTTLLLKNNFSAKAVSTLLGHSKEMITMDVYGDNEEIIADCVDELNNFINEVLPEQKITVRDESDFCIDDKLINELVIF